MREPEESRPLKGAVVDSEGREAELSEILGGKPSLLMLGYLDCPHLCSWSLATICRSVTELREEVGRDFRVVFLSLDPDESVEELAAERRRLERRYGRGNGSGWHFLKAEEAVVRQVASQVGFGYEAIDGGDFSHPAAFFVVDPQGVAQEAFYGLELPAARLAEAFEAANSGEERSWGEAFLMLCKKYNPLTGGYGREVEATLRVGGGLTLLGLVLGGYWTSKWRRRRWK